MKNAFAIILAGLLIFAALPVFAIDATAVNGVELGYDDGFAGPVRDDLGPDWITYDDGSPSGLMTGNPYWVKVNFTPNSLFRLQGIRFLPLNQGPNSNDEMRVMVYRLDQETLDFDELILDHTIDQVPAWPNWIVIELDEEDFAEFAQDEVFSILYDAPAGAYGNPPQNGTGWWCLFDGSDDFHRSYLASSQNLGDDPAESHDDWSRLSGDLLVRANGEYLEDFIDLGLVSVVNDDDAWMMTPGTSQQFVANVTNLSGDMGDAFAVAFTMFDPEGEVAWENEVRVEGIDEGDTIAVDASEVWQVADDAANGTYTLWVSLQVVDDANDENDNYGLDQIVSTFAEGNEQWLTYTDGGVESYTSWNEDSGWAGAFWHPGTEERALQLDGFRFLVAYDPDGDFPFDVDVSIMKLNLNENPPLVGLWEGTAEVTGNAIDLPGGRAGEWVTVMADDIEWDDPNEAVIFPGWAFMCTYFYDGRTVFPSDNNPPFAGTNPDMPPAYLSTSDDGAGYNFSNGGDFPIEAMLSWSNLMPPGVHMEIVPEALAFGDDIEPDVDHVINAMVYATGQETLEISEIRLAPSIANKINFNPAGNIEIASGDSLEIVVTFNTSELDTVASQALVRNNSADPNHVWPITARTRAMGVNENARPGVPTEYSLSQNHPNPFNPVTTVEFALVKSGVVSFDIFDMSGRLVQNVFNGSLPAGFHSVEIDASALSTGMYMYKIQTADFSSSRKMTLMK